MCGTSLGPAAIGLMLVAASLAAAGLAGAVLIRSTRRALAGPYATWDLCCLLSESGGRPGAARWARIDPADRPILARRRQWSRIGGLVLVAVSAVLWTALGTAC